jgi:transcription elongation factor Elf1
MKTEWVVSLKCERCGRQSNKYLKAKRMENKGIGCKECGLHTNIEIREHSVIVGGLDIKIYMPYYC